MLLEGKVAIVSGLGPGMGRDISLALAREGADIVMAARREKRMKAVAEEVEALGRRAVCVPTDITSAEDCARLAAAAKSELGRVDILVNNAFSDGNFKSFEDSDLAEWRDTFDVNFFAKTLARELGRDGVRVNGIHPGYIWGDSVEWYLKHLAEQNGTTFDIEYAKVADQTCLGYIVPSSEIAGTVVFFASPLSRPVTGQSLSVNGGSWLQ
jgi:NAD(P)-dependent dehydrogenase (short-subunit alcohol dehydrogenase family)